MDMIINVLLVFVGVAMVSYGAKWLVEGASSLARRLGISDLVIGLTIVAFGTSAPELMVTLTATFQGVSDVALGNVVGSNIFNIGVILGISGLILPLRLQKNTVRKEIPLTLLSALVVWAMAGDLAIDGRAPSLIGRIDWLLLLGFFLVFFYYTMELARQSKENESTPDMKQTPVWLAVGLVIIGLAGLMFGGRLMVDNAVDLARMAGISETVIGLTLVAMGTGVPELATSVAAVVRGNPDIAMGNVIGSCLFNSFFILGISAVIAPLPVDGLSPSDFIANVALTALVWVFSMRFDGSERKITRWAAGVLLAGYLVYLTWLLTHI